MRVQHNTAGYKLQVGYGSAEGKHVCDGEGTVNREPAAAKKDRRSRNSEGAN